MSGDVMTGRGIDQILPRPSEATTPGEEKKFSTG
jgi:hypothetical protein